MSAGLDPVRGQGRRAFCAGCCALLAGAALGAGEEPGRRPDAQPEKTTRETRATMPAGTLRDYRKDGAFFLMADAAGIYAVTAICTHKGCSVYAQGDEGFHCPCHDSEYDRAGHVTQGPAQRALRHLAVREATPGGALVVDVGREVPADERI